MRYAILIIIICTALITKAQSNYSNSNLYTTKEGLTNNSVYCMVQDSRGFLWLGTKEGLNRFDGSQFKQYFAEKNNINSLPNNNIFSVIEYQYGQLLIATGSGLAVLNTLTGKFENEKVKDSPLSAGSRITMNSLFKDPSGKIWVNHSGEIDMLDSNLNYVQRLSDLPWTKNLKGILVRFGKWYTDTKKRVWVASDTSGINIIDFTAKQVLNSKNNPKNLAYLKHTYMRSFFLDETTNLLWYAPWGLGLIRHDLVSGKETTQTFGYKSAGESVTINSILKNGSGNLFCAGGSSLYELNPTDLSYQGMVHHYGISLFQSADQLYWEATDHGLLKLPAPTYAKELLLNPKNNIQLNSCFGMITANTGKLYLLYWNNILAEVEQDHSKYAVYERNTEKKETFNCISTDKAGRIWIGTSHGMVLFNTENHSFVKPDFLPASIMQTHINALFCDETGDMWIVTRYPFRLFRFHMDQNKTEEIQNEVLNDFADLYSGNRVSQITEDNNHNLWMISKLGGGIIRYERGSNKWELFPRNWSKNRLLTERGLTSVNTDSAGCLWLTDFYGNGLIRYNYITDSIDQFTRNDGLPSDYIQNVCPAGHNDLLITTENGIAVFNTRSLKTKIKELPVSPTSLPGIQTETIFDNSTNSLVYLLDNRVFFIPVTSLSIATAPIKPLIDKISVNNIPRYIDPGLSRLSLTHKNNNIAFDFTGVQFLESNKVHFAYQLTGIDKTWKNADESHSAQYVNLPAGNYTFKLRSGNEPDAAAYTSFAFTITPPWWKTWWFRTALILFVVLSVYTFMKLRIQLVKKEAGLKHTIAETEMMALRAQMNPHFVFNCLNAIDNMIQTNQKDKATTYLTRFAQLIRLILESSKNNLVPFYKDYESLKLFLQLEQFRGNDKFEYELNADPELLNSGIQVPPLIIQPFVENAIHHGLMNKTDPDRKLHIQISLEKDYLKYIITDNGVGRQKAPELNRVNRTEHISYGIDIAKKRITLHNHNGVHPAVIITDLVDNNIPAGTKVELWLSVK